MPCSNSVFLRCCVNPSRVILPCNPTVDGTPFSSFVVGDIYLSNDQIQGNVCWEAISSYGGTLTNYEAPNYITYNGVFGPTCSGCTFDNGGNCVSANTVFSAATLTRCGKPEETVIVDVPTGTTFPVTFVVSGQCYSFSNFETGTTGDEYYPQYDDCSVCEPFFPFQYSFSGCCEYIDQFSGNSQIFFNLNSVPSGLDINESVYVETTTYTGCAVNIQYNSLYQLDLYSATTIYNDCDDCQTFEPFCYVNSYWENCCDSTQITLITNISSAFFPGNTLEISGQCYFYTGLVSNDPAIGNTDDFLNSYSDCNTCELSYPCPTPTPTPSQTPTPTPVPSSSPSVSPTPTPTISSSAALVPNQFNYSVAITGTCVGIGSALITASGGTAPYTFDWINPPLGTGAFKTGLSAGTYLVRANDSTMPINNEIFINVSISDGLTLVVSTVTDTTCGQDNGSVTVVATSDNSDITYFLYSGATLITSQSTTNLTAQFAPLAAGVYNVVGVNASGCSGSTGNFVIGDSDPFDFGFYVVNDTPCLSPTGKIFVTGQTGNGPYTYLWNNFQTTSSITGLTQGAYNVTVTNSQGCSLNKSVLVELVPSIGLGSWSATTPSCFASDGSLTLTITGGTGPYLYSGSNGTTFVTYSQSYTFSGLPAGSFFVSVTDAALCKATFSTTLQTPQSFYSVQEIVTNSTCSTSDGSVNVFLQGGSPPYTYSLSSSTFSVSALTNSTQYIFNNLPNGEYSLTITDGGPCPYISNFIIESEDLFEVSYSATTSSCGQPNGTLTIMTTTGGTLPYIYSLDNGQSITTSSLDVTFSSLEGGTYVYSITDASGCEITGSAVVPDESVLNFSLYPTTCGTSGSGGTITALITSGEPPFVYNWSSNVGGNPQDVFVTGLTAGTYSLTITDDNGCVKTRSVSIECSPVISTYQIFNMCQSDFTFTSGTKRGMVQMLNEGFNDLVFPSVDCILSASTFTIEVEVSGNTYSDLFYTGSTLLDVPTDAQYFQAVEDLLLGITGVVGVTIDPVTSQVTIESEDSLGGTVVTINLVIGYSILCPTPCPEVTPTPTPTVSATPDVSVTPTVTNSSTPTPTPTVSETPVVSVSPTPTITTTPSPTPTCAGPGDFLEGSACYSNEWPFFLRPSDTVACSDVQTNNSTDTNRYRSCCDYQSVFVDGDPTGCEVYDPAGNLVGNGFISDGCLSWEIFGGVVISGPTPCSGASGCCS
jgi:hypothetical protein